MSLFQKLFGLAPPESTLTTTFPYNGKTNPYECKRTWPPDFTKLSHAHQFNLERRFRRRTKLKFARPGWTRGTKLLQWGLILGSVWYGILYMEVDDRIISPFQPVSHAQTALFVRLADELCRSETGTLARPALQTYRNHQ
jgi:hypothetical protein